MDKRPAFGALFVATLVLSWTLITAAIGLAIWAERGGSPLRLATWASLWLFSVAAPTLNALEVHHTLGDLTATSVAPASLVERLKRLRPWLLLSANMALLSAFALIFGR